MLRTIIIGPDARQAQLLEQSLSALANELTVSRILLNYPDEGELVRTLRTYAPEVVFISFEKGEAAMKVVERVNQVWSTDITYIRMAEGFVYLVAIMDWFSRFVLSWSLSLTLEIGFCIEALKSALRRGRPEIFNSDQGSHFTSEKFTRELEAKQVAISMDGRGRCMDNIFIERLWRSLKYEEVYLKDYESVTEARTGIERYFRFYNHERLHQSLGYRTPAAVHLVG